MSVTTRVPGWCVTLGAMLLLGVPASEVAGQSGQPVLEEVLRQGGRRKTLLAALFGGSSILAGGDRDPRIGDQNVLEARSFLFYLLKLGGGQSFFLIDHQAFFIGKKFSKKSRQHAQALIWDA